MYFWVLVVEVVETKEYVHFYIFGKSDMIIGDQSIDRVRSRDDTRE